MQQINIYYGGRGLIEDPTIYVMNKLTEVLGELNIEVKKYNLYEDKQGISVLPKTLKEADGVILALPWSGLGSADFYSSFWMPAGFMETRIISRSFICFRLSPPLLPAKRTLIRR